MRALTASILCAWLCVAPAHASVPIVADSRIKTLVYNENEVYSITTHYGYQANVEFGNNETIEAVSVGDRVGWQIVPAGRRLFVRAMEENAHTNMTIVTSKRAYQFDLHSSSSNAVYGSAELTYVLRFYYPDVSGTPNLAIGAAPMDGGMPPQYQAPVSMPSSAPRGLPAPLPELPNSRYGAPSFGSGASANPFPSAPSAASSAPFSSAPIVVAGVVEAPTPVTSTPISPLQPIGTPHAAAPAPVATPAPAQVAMPAPAPVAPIPVATPAPAPQPAPVVAQAPIPAPTPAPLPVNYRYTYSGPDEVAPVKIFDDGKSTYFKFNRPLQGARFVAVDARGSEREVPYSINSEGLAVIDVVAARVKLMQSSGQVVVYNEAMG